MKKEEWKDIKDFEGVYVINKNGEVKRISEDKYSDRILKPQMVGDGTRLYSYIQLYDKYHIRKYFKVADLMAQAFLGVDLVNKKDFKTINKDGDNTNNKLENIDVVYYRSAKKRMLDQKRAGKDMKKLTYWAFVGVKTELSDNFLNLQICNYFDVPISDFKSSSKRAEVVTARRYASYIHHKLKGLGVEDTGEILGINHSTVTYHCKTLNDILFYSKQDKQHLENLKKLV